MKTIGILTCEEYPLLTEDDQLLIEPLFANGIKASPLVWSHDQGQALDGILVRSPWDYHLEAHRYIEWQKQREKSGTRFFNDLSYLKWNFDKKYLAQLSAASLPFVDTLFLNDSNLEKQLEHAFARNWNRWVVKPAISASAFETRVIDPSRSEDLNWIRSAASKRELLLQPYLHLIETQGELSIVAINGQVTHAAVKLPKTGDFRVQSEFGGSRSIQKVEAWHRAFANEFLDAAQRLSGSAESPLYARIDLVPDLNGSWVLGELELFEPALAFSESRESVQRLADALAARL